MRLHLVDVNTLLVRAWEIEFRAHQDVAVSEGDILKVAENSIVSPANSHGYMDGGIDFLYMQFFGEGIQSRVQEAISTRPEGMLPVGASLLVPTGNTRIPYLIVAPTMEFPEPVPASNAYRAMRAILRLAAKESVAIANIYCPGLATGTGRVDPEDAAREMAAAFRDWTMEQSS